MRKSQISGAVAYAKQRTLETGRPYIVHSLGGAMLDVPENRKTIAEIGAVPVFVSRKPSKERKGNA